MDSMVWTIPLMWGAILAFVKTECPELLRQKITYTYALCAAVIIYLWLSIESKRRASPDTMLEEKYRAQYKAVSRALCSKKPNGIIFGKQGKNYIRKPIADDGHILVIGGSGSGKSSAGAIVALLANPDVPVMAVDIKGELSYKATKLSNPKVLVVNPADRYSAGYDPLYKLSPDSSEMQIYDTMRLISISLISLPADVKDPFWKTSARNLLTGLLIYYYKSGVKNFIGLVDAILSKPVKESVAEIMEHAASTTTEYKYMTQFSDLADDTLGGIVVEMLNPLSLFANDLDVRYALRDNPVKATPAMLNEGYSIYLSIQEHQLTAYYNLLQLMLNETFHELEQRPEKSGQILFILDELPRLLSAGRIEKLLDGMKTLRSRRVTLYLITQSVEALMSAYSDNQAMDLISNCPYIMVLDANSSRTQKMIIEWAGKYLHRKNTWSSQTSKNSMSISYEDKNLVDSTDIMQLKQKNQVMLVSPYGFYIIDKCPYYTDPIMSKLSADCITCNDAIKNIKSTQIGGYGK